MGKPVMPKSKIYHKLNPEWVWILYWVAVFGICTTIAGLIWKTYVNMLIAIALHPFVTEFNELYRSREAWSEFELSFYKEYTMTWKTKQYVRCCLWATILTTIGFCWLYKSIEWIWIKRYLLSLIIPISLFALTYILETQINNKLKENTIKQ